MMTIPEITVKCPRCNSPEGYKCTTETGRSRSTPHKARREKYRISDCGSARHLNRALRESVREGMGIVQLEAQIAQLQEENARLREQNEIAADAFEVVADAINCEIPDDGKLDLEQFGLCAIGQMETLKLEIAQLQTTISQREARNKELVAALQAYVDAYGNVVSTEDKP